MLLLAGCATTHRETTIAVSKSASGTANPENVSLAHDFFLRAQRQEMPGNPAAALGYYQMAFTYNRESRDLCFLLLDHLRGAGKIDSALALGNTCFGLEGTPTATQYQMLGETWLRKDNADSAAKYYGEVARLDEDNREALFILTSLYERLRDLPRYTATLRKLLPQLDYSPRLVDKLIQAYAAMDQPDSAEDLYRELLDRNPNDAKVLFSYAMLLQGRNKYAEARPRFEKLAEAQPKNGLVLFELGINFERLGQRDSAKSILRRAVEADTLNSVAMNYLGYMLVEEDRELDYAGDLIDRALSLEPDNGAYLDSKGWWCYRKKDFSGAEEYLLKAARQIPGDSTIREHLNTVVKLLGRNPPPEK